MFTFHREIPQGQTPNLRQIGHPKTTQRTTLLVQIPGPLQKLLAGAVNSCEVLRTHVTHAGGEVVAMITDKTLGALASATAMGCEGSGELLGLLRAGDEVLRRQTKGTDIV